VVQRRGSYRIHDVVNVLIAEHPIVAHQVTHSGSDPVLRVSDCISDREFRSTRVYREIFVRQGASYQLAVITATGNPMLSGRSWFINRSIRDFTEAELEGTVAFKRRASSPPTKAGRQAPQAC
jgi:hypothetical protein